MGAGFSARGPQVALPNWSVCWDAPQNAQKTGSERQSCRVVKARGWHTSAAKILTAEPAKSTAQVKGVSSY